MDYMREFPEELPAYYTILSYGKILVIQKKTLY